MDNYSCGYKNANDPGTCSKITQIMTSKITPVSNSSFRVVDDTSISWTMPLDNGTGTREFTCGQTYINAHAMPGVWSCVYSDNGGEKITTSAAHDEIKGTHFLVLKNPYMSISFAPRDE